MVEIASYEEIEGEENTYDSDVCSEEGETSSNATKKIEYDTGIEVGTPGGTRLWMPYVEDENVRPVVGQVFDTLEDGIRMYGMYGYHSGFDVRLATQKRLKNEIISEKHVLCSKAGNPANVNYNSLDKENSDKITRNSNLKKTGCKAHVIFKLVPGSATKVMLWKFAEMHNHMLVGKDYRHLLRKDRQLTYSEQRFIVKAATTNIGATKAHHLYMGMKGAYNLVHGTTVDFKNFRRDINCLIGDSDAQILINKMENRKKYVSNFTFEYKIENSKLCAMFWADELAKYNYLEFGDIISFDATFNTNK